MSTVAILENCEHGVIRASCAECPHVCTPESCPPGFYYVTCIDGDKWWKMAGPYATHAEALADQKRVRRIADDIDPRSVWKSWGTAKMKDGYSEPGTMNRLGLV
jgi:hypothetical protein